MVQLLKKSAFVGIGLAVLSTSAIKKMGEKIAEESKLSEEEGKKLIEDLLQESERSKETLKKKVDDTVKDSIVEMDLATSTDIDSINHRLDGIERELRASSRMDASSTKEDIS